MIRDMKTKGGSSIEGLADFSRRMKKLSRNIQNETDKAAFKSALEIRSKAIQDMSSGSKTGRVYIRGGVSHQASARGESPAVDTGSLIAAIDVKVLPKALNKSTALVGVFEAITNRRTGKRTINYAALLELGRHSRPWLFPAYLASIDDIKRIIAKAVQKAIKDNRKR